MPIYEFKCDRCGATLTTRLLLYPDGKLRLCAAVDCPGVMERVFSTFSIRVK